MEENKKNGNAALLVMDVQGATMMMLGEKGISYLETLNKSIKAARDKKLPVIYVVIAFRKGFPDVSPNSKMFERIKSGAINLDGDAVKVHASVEPHPDDIIVTKKRVSAFTGSDLEVVLRAQGIKHIVLTGIATSGVVLSTLREASDKDYTITVLSDCCADMDEEVHRVLTTKIFPRQAEVITTEEWAK